MFFIFSKLLYFLLKPSVWIGGFLLYAAFGKGPRWRKRSVYLALASYWLFSNIFLANQLMRLWEPESLTANEIETPYDIGILLGGYSNVFTVPDHDRHNFSDRGNRFFQAYELYQTGKVKKLLLSGGSGNLLQNVPGEAGLMKAYLMRIGIPESDIIVENTSRNTRENAVFTKEILDRDYPGARCLLLTSAWHMRRSKACFDKAGQPTTPYCVDYLSERTRYNPEILILPHRFGLYYWELMIKEMVGCVMYRLQGYN